VALQIEHTRLVRIAIPQQAEPASHVFRDDRIDGINGRLSL